MQGGDISENLKGDTVPLKALENYSRIWLWPEYESLANPIVFTHLLIIGGRNVSHDHTEQ